MAKIQVDAETEIGKNKPRNIKPKGLETVKELALLLSFEDKAELIRVLKSSLVNDVSQRKVVISEDEQLIEDL